jgi:hypothetical protein
MARIKSIVGARDIGAYRPYFVCSECSAVHNGNRECCRDCGNESLQRKIGRLIKTVTREGSLFRFTQHSYAYEWRDNETR